MLSFGLGNYTAAPVFSAPTIPELLAARWARIQLGEAAGEFTRADMGGSSPAQPPVRLPDP